MSQLTVRGLDPEVEHLLRDAARREGVSLNRVALRLLRRGAGLSEPAVDEDTIGDELDEFLGTMSAEEERLILQDIADFERIDAEEPA
jgi:hypothetical protein